jgi:Predicted membrane protein
MFNLSLGAGELVLRAAIVYIFLLLAFRVIGKKHVGELAPFDLLVLLILSETVQNSLIGDDKSLIGGLISAATLLALVQGINYLNWHSKGASRFLEGVPKILVRNGKTYIPVMERERVTHSELLEAMRSNGCSNIIDVRAAILENDGKISIIKRESKP